MHPLFLPPAPVPARRPQAVGPPRFRVNPAPVAPHPRPGSSSLVACAPRNARRRPSPVALGPLALLALHVLPTRAAAAPAAPTPAPVVRAAPAARRARPAHAALAVAPATAATAHNAKPSITDVVSFWFGEYLMWNPGAKVLSLFAITLLCMYLGSFLYRLADPDGTEAEYPFWHAVRAIANPLEDDWNKNSLRTTSIALAGIGMVVFAILVGMVTESVESAVANVDGELSRVVVSDHILVCGWSPHVSQILKDVNKVSPRTRVVVLASPDQKVGMFDEIRSALSEEQRRHLRVFYRPGAPIIEEDLARVAAGRAKKIILVNTRRGDPVDADRLILSRALALRQNLPSFSGDIVAELNSVRDENILRSILSETKAKTVETINAEQLLFRFMAQAIRQPGLADVVAELMGDDPASVFHVLPAREAAPNLVGTNFADLRPTSVPGSVLCGFFDNDGVVHIETGQSYTASGPTVGPNTNLLLLGTRSRATGMPQRTLQVSKSAASIMQVFNAANVKGLKKTPEHFLVCGWRRDMEDMLRELDTVLASGSKVTILDEDTPESLSLGLKNVAVTTVKERADRYENLADLLAPKAKPYDHVVLLGSAIGDDAEARSRMGREEDTKTLASLVYVNELLAQQREYLSSKKGEPKETMVTVEFINERVASMAKEQNNIANAILPQNLSAKIAAQTVRDSRLNAVWRELLSQRGREVYLRPCAAYEGVSGESTSYAGLADRLGRDEDDIVLGYITTEGKVVINPQGDDKFLGRFWDKSDMLIVLSEH